jgi:hypothetical protein
MPAMRAGAAILLTLMACGGEPTPEATTPPMTANRPVTPRKDLPAAIQPLLPQHGIYVAGGGLVSTPWRIVVDIDADTIFVGSSETANAPSYGPLDKEATKPLSPRNETHLMQMAYAAWAEPPPAEPPNPIADYDEILVVLEGNDAFYLQGYGPIRQPVAAKAIVELRAAAGL